jgi:ribosomal protein S24E
MKVIENKENIMLGRREIKMIVEAGKNPSYPEALKQVADHFKSSEELVEVKEIQGKFGRSTFLISAFIYGNKENKDKLEKKKEKKKVV